MSVKFPAPAEREIPRTRLEARRRHLVQEAAAAQPARQPVRRARARWLLPTGGLAAAAVATAIAFVGVGGNGSESASAATVLRQAAAVASRQAAAPEPGPGEFVYMKRVSAYLSVFRRVKRRSPSSCRVLRNSGSGRTAGELCRRAAAQSS